MNTHPTPTPSRPTHCECCGQSRSFIKKLKNKSFRNKELRSITKKVNRLLFEVKNYRKIFKLGE
jgi:hypothetical protein